MKRKVKEIKRIARENLTGRYLVLMKAFVWINALILLVELPFYALQSAELYSTQNIIYLIAQILIRIISIVLVCGQYKMHLSAARGKEPDSKDLFALLKAQPDRYILTNFILFGMTLLCLIPAFISLAILYFLDDLVWIPVVLILTVISIVLSTYIWLTFHLVFFHLAEDEALTPVEALKTVRRTMHTNKRRFLYLQLSFLGLQFVNLFSFGIGTLWLEPYMTQTTTVFYLDTKGELDTILAERKAADRSPEPEMFNQYV